jgi:D-alanine-D-alanine ligase
MNRRFTHVAVLKGGISSEREVSLRSGEAVAQGLREGGYSVTEVDLVSRELALPSGVEAVFIALHGMFGEDGGIQEMLTSRGVPYTGSGAESSRISFDKVLTRERLAAAGIPVPKGEVLSRADERTLPVPLVVKPPREGSSVGCHIVTEDARWAEAFSDAVRFSGEALVEEYIPGRELTVGVVERQKDDSRDPGNDLRFQVLPVVEIRPAAEWYDYEAKYITGETEYTVPAELDKGTTEVLQSTALKTFRCLGAEGFGRVDFRLSPEGHPYVLELNAIPGFTATSLLPKAAAADGIGFPELCCRIMENASA